MLGRWPRKLISPTLPRLTKICLPCSSGHFLTDITCASGIAIQWAQALNGWSNLKQCLSCRRFGIWLLGIRSAKISAISEWIG